MINKLRALFKDDDLEKSFAAIQQFCDVEVKSLERSFPRTDKSDRLGYLFTQYGSDKALGMLPPTGRKNVGHHMYHLFYSTIDNEKPLNILEIGIGTNDTSFAGHMGAQGKPGASLRAFRDWGPHFQLYGADYDRGCLFQEERIKTFFADQSDPLTLFALGAQLPQMDLIIDDGLHRPWTNFNTLSFALPLLKENGIFVVEDIGSKYLPWWKMIVKIMGGQLYQEDSGKRRCIYTFIKNHTKSPVETP